MSSAAFIRAFLAAFLFLSVATYLLILLVDPYRNVPFSLPMDRAPISTNQRFAYPTLARDLAFDSVIIGSSTMRLLNPENLNADLGARFANLAMNSATAYEQMKLYDLFMRHHPGTKFAFIGIDDSWCKREKNVEKYTFREFPEWMYDDNRWNDLLYMFNDKALENTVRLLEYGAGARQSKYEKNGYRDFTVDFGLYDRDVVHQRLYPNGKSMQSQESRVRPLKEHREWQFAAHALLENSLLHHSSDTEHTVLVFAPFHGAYQRKSRPTYAECKTRIRQIATVAGVRILDFMIESPITKTDDNYWDPLHFTAEVARALEHDIARELLNPGTQSPHYLSY